MPGTAFKDLVIDAQDAIRTAEFWARAIGLTAEPLEPGPNAVLSGDRTEQTIWINQVPEPRSVKQRVHLDLWADPANCCGWVRWSTPSTRAGP